MMSGKKVRSGKRMVSRMGDGRRRKKVKAEVVKSSYLHNAIDENNR